MNENTIKNDMVKQIGLRVKEYRLKRGLTQEKLSEIIDVSPTYIAMMETGKTGMSMETLIKMSKALKITPNDILQDYVTNYFIADEVSEYIVNRISELDDKEKRLVMKITEDIISEK